MPKVVDGHLHLFRKVSAEYPRIPIETNWLAATGTSSSGAASPASSAKEPIATTGNEADERAHHL